MVWIALTENRALEDHAVCDLNRRPDWVADESINLDADNLVRGWGVGGFGELRCNFGRQILRDLRQADGSRYPECSANQSGDTKTEVGPVRICEAHICVIHD